MSLTPQSARQRGGQPRPAAPTRTARACVGLAAAGLLLGACGGTAATHPPPSAGSTTTGPATTSTTDRPSTTTTLAPATTTTDRHATTTTSTRPAPTTTTDPLSPPPPPVPGRVTVVGDSVMVDAQPYLAHDIPGAYINAAVSRQWGTGEQILAYLSDHHQLSPIVVVGLGLNGPIDDADFQAMMAAVPGAKRVIFLTIHLPRGAYGPGTDWWQDQNNSVLVTMVPKYHDAVLANWYAYSEPHPGWFYSDGIHLDPTGAAAMAAFITRYI
jgi:hypothetical protein